jgi:hypothetical protein
MKSTLMSLSNALKAEPDIEMLGVVFYGGILFAVILSFIGGLR